MSNLKSLLLAFCSLFLLAGCSNVEVLNPKGPMASDLRFLIIYSIIFMVGIIAVVSILFAIFTWKYRYTKTTESGKVHHNPILETVWFIVPVLILIALMIPTVKSLYKFEEPPKAEDDPIVIYAVSGGYKWFFAYPEEKIETVNHLTIPTNRPITFKLQAMDTMTSFWIPQLGGQKYAMTAMTMEWTLQADKEGTYRGRNSNFNGEGFWRHTFQVHAVSQEKYDEWVKKAQSQKVLDQDTFDKQLLPITENKALTFSGTHMAFVDPAADPQYLFYAYKRFNFVQKDMNFNDDPAEGVLSEPNKPARKVTVTNENYARHGMQPAILKNNEPYNNEFKKEEEHTMNEMESMHEGAKNAKAHKDHKSGGGH
ncbi:cytochrome aa3 quinol oxidase subunit II [Staphylococcus americanisciuri]|uniref:Probable quinol oxidase subunit 2 n=1 Tax=Staphylococcus americanisciuri TaxID=2973940 RepID=A0ABT2F2S8_9STAP|nr:cytochrome aa3 quinol oxidase subunit II [Staphylococcus americanisciuri]MCS4486677.1 cytochrome aa3 quinol oxidase subunit II [Staphylococcus americanisciuri]